VITNHFGANPRKGGSPPNEIRRIIILIEEPFDILYQKFEIETRLNILAAATTILKIKL
jgi:hypothetical protein